MSKSPQEDQLREVNEALLVSSVHQHELTEKAQRAEAALRESEERYRNLFDSMDEGYCIIDVIFDEHEKAVDYRFLEVNASFEKQSGMHDVVGKRMLEFVPSIEEHWLTNYGHAALTGEPIRFANEYKTLNRWFDVYAFKVGESDATRVAVLFTDITERKRVGEALRDSETQYRSLFESAPMAVFVCDRNAVIQQYNPIAAELWGREPECGVERHCGSMKLWLPDGELLPHTESPMVEVLRTGIPAHNVEVFIERPDGSHLPVLVNFAALKNENGEITGAITSFTDITERKQAELALAESEARFRMMSDNIPQLAWIADAGTDGKVYWFNKSWLDYTGATLEEMQGSGWQIVHHPDHAARVIEKFESHVRESLDWEDTFPLRGRDGQYRWFLSRMNCIRDTSGNVVRIFGTNTDITETRKAELELRAAIEFNRAVLENMAEGLYTTDAAGALTSMNKAAEQLFGWTFDEIAGRNIHEVAHYKHRDGTPYAADECPNLRVLGDGQPIMGGSEVFIRRDGTFFDAQFSSSPLTHNGAITGMVVVIEDVTARKELAQELAAYRKDLEKLVVKRTAALARSNKDLKSESAERLRIETERVRLLKQVVTIQEDERRRIARDLHDDLGQKLTGLRLKLENARKICNEQPVCDEIEATQTLAMTLDADIGFLAWELRPPALDDMGLADALREFVREWSRFSAVNAEFRVRGLHGERLTPETEINLYRIVQEALNNAHKYAKAQNVSVMLEKRKYDIALIIEDDGVGFDPKKAAKSKGGLGLTGMAERAELLGGTIHIESSPGAGTTIFVRVPSQNCLR